MSAEHLRSNVRALQVAWDEAAAERLQAVAEEPQQYWASRARLPWN
jgi:hypothetical protein